MRGAKGKRNMPVITSTITTTVGISVLFKLTSNHFLYFNFFSFLGLFIQDTLWNHSNKIIHWTSNIFIRQGVVKIALWSNDSMLSTHISYTSKRCVCVKTLRQLVCLM